MEYCLQNSIYRKSIETQTSQEEGVQRYYRTCIPVLSTLFSVFVIICASIFLDDTINLIKGGAHEENYPGVMTLSVFTSASCVAIVIALFQIAANIFCVKDFEKKIHSWCIIHLACALSLCGSTSFAYVYRADILATGQLFLMNSFINSMASLTLVFFLYFNWL